MGLEILLVNVHSCRNAGDAALTHVAIDQLEEHLPVGHLTLAMDDPASHTGKGEAIDSLFRLVRNGDRWDVGGLLQLIPATLFPILARRALGAQVPILTPKRWLPLVQAYTRADLIVSKPGGFLYSSGRGLSLLISIYTLALGLLAEKPVYLLPQSIGPLSRWWEHVALKHVLRDVRLIMVREPGSLRQAEAWGLPKDSCFLIPDPGFSYPAASDSAARRYLHEHGVDPSDNVPLLGMTVINWKAQNPIFEQQVQYEAACAEAARLFIERYGGKVILFPQVVGPSPSQDDRVPSRRVADRLTGLSSSVVVIEEPTPPDLLKSAYGLMRLFIGTRMHSSIFALSQGVPVIAIGYQPKTLGILEMVELDEWVIAIDEVTQKNLPRLVEELWERGDEIRAHLQQTIPHLIRQTHRGGSIIAVDFSGQEGCS